MTRRSKVLTTAAVAVALVWATHGRWTRAIAEGLACADDASQSDMILVDNSDQNYLAFAKAAELHRSGLANRIAVPVQSNGNNPLAVAEGFVEVMARVSALGAFDVIPVTDTEPITLNVAYRVRAYATERQVRSILIAVPALRSRRTLAVYEAAMRGTGMNVRCVPVFGHTTPDNWTTSWHAIEDVTEQFLKLQYYRAAVLPFVRRTAGIPNR